MHTSELGVNFEAREPFHRASNLISGYIRYSDIYKSLKREAELQNLKGAKITPHSLRSGGADANAKALGDAATKKFGNWIGKSFRGYIDSSNTAAGRV